MPLPLGLRALPRPCRGRQSVRSGTASRSGQRGAVLDRSVTVNTPPHRPRRISRDSAASPQPVGRLVADLVGLAAQHRVLVPEDQEFGILGQFTRHSTIRQPSRERASR